MYYKKIRNIKGFSLIEVVIATTIAMLIITFSISYFLFLDKRKTESSKENQTLNQVISIFEILDKDLLQPISLITISDSTFHFSNRKKTCFYSFNNHLLKRNDMVLNKKRVIDDVKFAIINNDRNIQKGMNFFELTLIVDGKEEKLVRRIDIEDVLGL